MQGLDFLTSPSPSMDSTTLQMVRGHLQFISLLISIEDYCYSLHINVWREPKRHLISERYISDALKRTMYLLWYLDMLTCQAPPRDFYVQVHTSRIQVLECRAIYFCSLRRSGGLQVFVFAWVPPPVALISTKTRTLEKKVNIVVWTEMEDVGRVCHGIEVVGGCLGLEQFYSSCSGKLSASCDAPRLMDWTFSVDQCS